ncbi:MAG: hypothetical protein RIA63_13955, partial [Cyclobacteriaceae bacterium]
GPELAERSTDTRHYMVTIKSVTATKAEDDPIQEQVAQVGTDVVKGVGQAAAAIGGVFGADKKAQDDVKSATTIKLTPDPEIEIYGAVLVYPDRSLTVGDPNTTNANAWSRDRVQAEKNIRVGRSFAVNNTKHYYAKDGSNPTITIRSKLKEYDEGEHYSSDGGFVGGITISNLGQWNWASGQRMDESFEARVVDSGKESIVRIDYTITLEPKISVDQIRQAVATRDINNVSRLLLKGADIKQGSVLEPAIQNKDVPMINFLLASGAVMYDQDLTTALQPQFFSQEIATKLIVRKGSPPTPADLDKAIAVNSKSVVNLMLSGGAKPTAVQLQNALNQNELEIAEALLVNKAPASPADLGQAVGKMNVPVTALLVKYGVQPDVNMLNQALQANNKEMVKLLLQSQNPDQTSFQLAADKNDPALFTMLSSKGVLLDSDGPSQKAIDFNNLELLKQTLLSGASSSNALSYAVQKENLAAINTCLEFDGNPNLAVGYAALKNDAALFSKLITTYKA